jgi:CheY-like chemotaxis protein
VSRFHYTGYARYALYLAAPAVHTFRVGNAEQRKLRVMVADDNRDTVLTLSLLLEDEGHEVHGFYDGADAMNATRANKYDAIILDIEMPEMSGYAVAQDIRTFYYRNEPGPLLIAISGKWNKPTDKLLAHLVGFDHHLRKPCDPQALFKLLLPLQLRSEQH